ncbi:tyrosine-type recombinase/integrase [Anaerobacillus isosaccharinicus]|nr:tyrosine-type recombinase/integrase [Anaerobacillus isosaccharinicus]MBA5583992.1 tyrosine-type recombinase/integrase [Anaerobacillus isosaccharinicus]MBA5585012.1 tyrosine-type recombinase/integrase [Anaerobacillus isosaccharinicus]MBA5587040.1 tyrosine-type recombinase/integrase [Anaerobacillus isosaccharinicus]MBA5587097.1 tyrosine-type recombinase/integrase [Anaerobacillus isosaccharinicus]QOY34707.1 tyrosine-type recombinase/integrase [Anaerobacillus isosaccharinicus]
MSKKNVVFNSILGDLIYGFIEEKKAVGYNYTKGSSLLRQFDTLANKERLAELKLPKELVLLWTEKRPNETASTRNGRISIVRGLAKYMVRLGHEAYIFPPAAIVIYRYSYIPYIFTEIELKGIFTVCDSLNVSSVSPNRHLILSLLLRILYGCGLRISEALNLTLCDVDLDQGSLFIRDTKFGKERIVPMAETLTERCRLFIDKIHQFNADDTFLFASPYGGRYKESTIYKLFRDILWKAGISHSGRGPRLHDIRHSYSVHCLKKWVLNGEDLTSLLPYLSTFLGHVDLRGTQHYLRLTGDLYPNILATVERNSSSIIPEVLFDEAD